MPRRPALRRGWRHNRPLASCATNTPTAMLINFFFTLRAAKLKVSVKEYLMLLDAIKEVTQGGSSMTTHIARKVVQSFLKTGPSC